MQIEIPPPSLTPAHPFTSKQFGSAYGSIWQIEKQRLKCTVVILEPGNFYILLIFLLVCT